MNIVIHEVYKTVFNDISSQSMFLDWPDRHNIYISVYMPISNILKQILQPLTNK